MYRGAERGGRQKLELVYSGHEKDSPEVVSVIGERLTLEGFYQLSGRMAGYSFVKVVVERADKKIHFINDRYNKLHVDYIAENILHVSKLKLREQIDEFNQRVYLSNHREYYLGVIALHNRDEKQFFSLETVEIDNMNSEMLIEFYDIVKKNLDPTIPVLFKPANHLQETTVSKIDSIQLPRIFSHELFASSTYVALNPGSTRGRLRVFENKEDYLKSIKTLEWYDIVVMKRVPDNIPRVAGLINSEHTTPLSHTNVLACGWQIPNSIQIGIIEDIKSKNLADTWVSYKVEIDQPAISIEKISESLHDLKKPEWTIHRVKIEAPEISNTPIRELNELRMTDRFRYGTKAANIGELNHILRLGSEKLIGFYRIPHPPRKNLLPYLASFLGIRPEESCQNTITQAAQDYIRKNIAIPKGIAIPFSIQQEILATSPQIQQQIGKLKMALELKAREVDSLCLRLQQMIRGIRIPDTMRDLIDYRIASSLGGVSSFVVRSSSNAEDLEEFSAAGIYESKNHVVTAEKIFESIKAVWASLVSPRSIRLREDVGIPLDNVYMGVIIQEEVTSDMGGVLVTTNPTNPSDIRSVYINASKKSVNSVVEGTDQPYQYLFNTLEGGGRTLSIGSSKNDLSQSDKESLQRLAFIGRLLQSHFSLDYTFKHPLDIEWATHNQTIQILQIRPYAK